MTKSHASGTGSKIWLLYPSNGIETISCPEGTVSLNAKGGIQQALSSSSISAKEFVLTTTFGSIGSESNPIHANTRLLRLQAPQGSAYLQEYGDVTFEGSVVHDVLSFRSNGSSTEQQGAVIDPRIALFDEVGNVFLTDLELEAGEFISTQGNVHVTVNNHGEAFTLLNDINGRSVGGSIAAGEFALTTGQGPLIVNGNVSARNGDLKLNSVASITVKPGRTLSATGGNLTLNSGYVLYPEFPVVTTADMSIEIGSGSILQTPSGGSVVVFAGDNSEAGILKPPENPGRIWVKGDVNFAFASRIRGALGDVLNSSAGKIILNPGFPSSSQNNATIKLDRSVTIQTGLGEIPPPPPDPFAPASYVNIGTSDCAGFHNTKSEHWTLFYCGNPMILRVVNDDLHLQKGEFLLSSRKRSIVFAGAFEAVASPGSILLVCNDGDMQKIVVLSDKHKRSVQVTVAKRTYSLSQGEEFVVAQRMDDALSVNNIGRRRSEMIAFGALTAICSEVSIPTLLKGNELLSELRIESQQREAGKVLYRVLKTAAGLALVTSNHGAYREGF